MQIKEALKTLGVDFTLNFKDVRKRYIELMKKYHTDKTLDIKTLENAKLVNAAYDVCKENKASFAMNIEKLNNEFFSYYDYDNKIYDEFDYIRSFISWVRSCEEDFRSIFKDNKTNLEILLDRKYKEYLLRTSDNDVVIQLFSISRKLDFKEFLQYLISYSMREEKQSYSYS